jgi:translation initiation factor 6 (eIF-6)
MMTNQEISEIKAGEVLFDIENNCVVIVDIININYIRGKMYGEMFCHNKEKFIIPYFIENNDFQYLKRLTPELKLELL